MYRKKFNHLMSGLVRNPNRYDDITDLFHDCEQWDDFATWEEQDMIPWRRRQYDFDGDQGYYFLRASLDLYTGKDKQEYVDELVKYADSNASFIDLVSKLENYYFHQQMTDMLFHNDDDDDNETSNDADNVLPF